MFRKETVPSPVKKPLKTRVLESMTDKENVEGSGDKQSVQTGVKRTLDSMCNNKPSKKAKTCKESKPPAEKSTKPKAKTGGNSKKLTVPKGQRQLTAFFRI